MVDCRSPKARMPALLTSTSRRRASAVIAATTAAHPVRAGHVQAPRVRPRPHGPHRGRELGLEHVASRSPSHPLRRTRASIAAPDTPSRACHEHDFAVEVESFCHRPLRSWGNRLIQTKLTARTTDRPELQPERIAGQRRLERDERARRGSPRRRRATHRSRRGYWRARRPKRAANLAPPSRGPRTVAARS